MNGFGYRGIFLTIRDYRADEFFEEFRGQPLPNFLFILGDDVDQRFFIRKSLKTLFETNHEVDNVIDSFIHEAEGSQITFREVKSHGIHNGMFFDQKLVYLENFKKFKNFKKIKPKSIVDYLISGDLENFLVLDIYSNTVPEEIKSLDSYGLDVHVIDASIPKPTSKEAKSLVGFFCELYLGFKPQIGFIEFLIKKNSLKYLNIWQDLYTIDLFSDSIDRETLDEVLYKTVVTKKKNQGVDFLLVNILTFNKVNALNFVEAYYKSEDKTIPLLLKLHDFFEKLYLIKVKQNLNDYELSRLTYLSSKKIAIMRNFIPRWSEDKIKSIICELASIDSSYVKSKFSKTVGKTLIEQLVIRNS